MLLGNWVGVKNMSRHQYSRLERTQDDTKNSLSTMLRKYAKNIAYHHLIITIGFLDGPTTA